MHQVTSQSLMSPILIFNSPNKPNRSMKMQYSSCNCFLSILALPAKAILRSSYDHTVKLVNPTVQFFRTCPSKAPFPKMMLLSSGISNSKRAQAGKLVKTKSVPFEKQPSPIEAVLSLGTERGLKSAKVKLLETLLTLPIVREVREKHVSRLNELKKVNERLLIDKDLRA